MPVMEWGSLSVFDISRLGEIVLLLQSATQTEALLEKVIDYDKENSSKFKEVIQWGWVIDDSYYVNSHMY